jgi:WD40 repeat protein
MSLRSASSILAVASLLTGRTVWAAPEPGTAKKNILDAYGDPLPHRAILRIGTVRLRHGDIVNCVAFSPDGNTVVSGSWDGTLRSWDKATGKELHRFQGHQRAVMSACITKDGKTLASISQDFTVRLWDMGTGKEVRKLNAPRGGYYDLSFSPDEQTLVCCGQNVTVWETKTYRMIHEFELNIQVWLTCLAFSPDGKTLAVGSRDGLIRFWDTANWKLVRQVQAHLKEKRGVTSLAFSPNGKYLASAGEDGLLSLRNAATGEEIRPLFKGKPRGCSRLAFSPDSKMLAWFWGAELAIRLFEVPTGKEIRQIQESQHLIQAVAFSPDGKTLASAGFSTVRLWDVPTGKELLPCTNHIMRLPLSSFARTTKYWPGRLGGR